MHTISHYGSRTSELGLGSALTDQQAGQGNHCDWLKGGTNKLVPAVAAAAWLHPSVRNFVIVAMTALLKRQICSRNTPATAPCEERQLSILVVGQTSA